MIYENAHTSPHHVSETRYCTIITSKQGVTAPLYAVGFISRQSWVLCLLLLRSLIMCANNRVHYDPMVVLFCLHISLPPYHHYTDLSESIELLKCLSGKFCLKYVKIMSILLIILHAIYGAVRIQCTHFSWNDCENMCTLYLREYVHKGLFRIHCHIFITWQHPTYDATMI